MKKSLIVIFITAFILSVVNLYGDRMYVEKDIIPTYYGYSYDINWDGHDAYLYSYVSDFDTSLSHPILVGTDYDNANEWGRGHVQFDLSSIPSDATILYAGLELYVGYVGQWNDEWDSHHARIKIYSMWRNQADYSPHDGDVYTYDLFDDADDGVLYGTTGYITMDSQFDKYFPSDTSYFDLGGDFVDSVQSRIASGIDWIGLGFTHYDPNNDWDEGVDLFGKLTKLHIVYQPADAPILLNPSILPDSGDTNTYFKYAIDYVDSSGYVPDTALCIIDDTIRIPLVLSNGSAANGNYSVKTTFSDTGWHNYYFRFVNSYGNIVLYPSDAPNTKLTGPFVEYGLGIEENGSLKNDFTWRIRDNYLSIRGSMRIESVDIFSLNGSKIIHGDYNSKNIIIPLKISNKMLFCKVNFTDGRQKLIKIISIK